MSKGKKITFGNYVLTMVAGCLALFSILCFFYNNWWSAGLAMVGLILVSHRKLLIIDQQKKSVILCSKLMGIDYNKKQIPVQPGEGKIILLSSIHEVFGMDKKSSSLYNYDVYYQFNNKKRLLFVSTNESRAHKVARFISGNLNIQLEEETREQKDR